MSVTGSQERTFLRLLTHLRPHWRNDPALPARIQSLIAGHREFGSRDRRLYRELIYTAVRFLPWVEARLDSDPREAVRCVAWLAAETPATKAFREAYVSGEPPSGDRTELLPGWFRAHCPEIFTGGELEAQLRRAPVWLRLQSTPPSRVLDEFGRLGWIWRQSPVLEDAIELLSDADLTKTEAWAAGLVEVQDLGSQLILETIGVERGARWLDACAGAGGKTLQLAGLLGPEGLIDAHDIRPAALEELRGRARRAGIAVSDAANRRPANASSMFAPIRILGRPEAQYDGVLVDAPCSGSGTWRRAPHLKWCTSEVQVARAAETQRSLLGQFSAQVKPGGRLVYATCSLSRMENEEVVAAFLAAHPEFEPAPFAKSFDLQRRGAGLLILPARHNTDGFFVASLRRRG